MLCVVGLWGRQDVWEGNMVDRRECDWEGCLDVMWALYMHAGWEYVWQH